jgi:TRAP-type C4-dicarboxylate transport system permease small subunit
MLADMLIKWVEKGSKVLLGTLIGAMAIVVMLQVFVRYVLKVPLFWTEELGRYLMIWAGMIGAALGISYGAHASIEMVVKLFPRRFQAGLGALAYLLMLVFAALTIVASISLMQFLKFQISPAMRISMVYPYLAIPAGCMIMIILIIPRFIEMIRSIPRKNR